MKFFICFAIVIAAVATSVAASPAVNSGDSAPGNAGTVSSGSSAAGGGTNQDAAESDVQRAVQHVAIPSAVDFSRFRKSTGYGASIPSPPCPKNYLFSCQPNLSPIACSAPAPSYGSQGAYSAPIPTYVAPLRGNFGVPQGIGYNTNQYYQY